MPDLKPMSGMTSRGTIEHDVRVPIRPGREVVIKQIPKDLTPNEANKIARLIKAYAVKQ